LTDRYAKRVSRRGCWRELSSTATGVTGPDNAHRLDPPNTKELRDANSSCHRLELEIIHAVSAYLNPWQTEHQRTVTQLS
jgi:hypothetical protein